VDTNGAKDTLCTAVELSEECTMHMIYYSFPADQVQVGVAYTVDVYGVAESANLSVESEELHEKIIVKSSTELALYVEEPIFYGPFFSKKKIKKKNQKKKSKKKKPDPKFDNYEIS
jgi:hypothetical protein